MAQSPTVALPKRLPLVISPANRDETTLKDAKLVNCYMETGEDKEPWIYKRPGVASSSQPSGGAANGYGMYNWKGDIYSIFGNTVYKNGVALSGTVDTTNGVYRFNSCLGATPKLQLGNGVKGYNYDASNGLVVISDVSFPASFVKGWAYLDATTYIMTAGANIRGGAINDPTTWDALNVIVAQIEPDAGVAINKQISYVIAFKQWTTEIFYDAANATGSPLGSYPTARLNWGCVSAETVQDMDGMLFWVATNRSSAVQVMMMLNLLATPISTKPIERLLDEADFSKVYSFTFKHDGHKFYVLTLVNNNLTLVYDASENAWHQWTDANGNYFPFVANTYDSSLKHYLQHETDGRIYQFDTPYYTDAGSLITVDVYTPNFDGGTRRRKLMNKLEFITDQVTGSSLNVRVSDDDYQTWSNFRAVDLSQPNPFLTDCGTFTRRAHNFRHRANTSFRLQAAEMQLDLGTL